MRANAWAVLAVTTVLPVLVGCTDHVGPERITAGPAPSIATSDGLDAELRGYLASLGFTGRIGATLEARLGRRVDHRLADVGRMLWFDPITGLNDDNSCAGCHSPTNGFGDTQSIAIGIDNNRIVGPGRRGPRNQRRTPMAINTAFFPTLMWNSRFRALSGDPFDNSAGWQFPPPEGRTLSYLPHLLTAQAFIPPTERVEVAGFAFPGDNDDIRDEVLRRLNATPSYRRLFGKVFAEVRAGAPITFDHFGRAIAEFEFTLVFADAPIDRYARGERTHSPRDRSAARLLFFGRAGCVACHRVAGASNEMFSDFREHVIGVPQVAPSFGNVAFDGPGANEDFGLEQVTGAPATATCSARRRCGTWRSSRRSCTTAPSCDWRTPSATTSTRRRPRAPTPPATSLPTCADRPVRSRPCSSASTRGSAPAAPVGRRVRRPRRLRAQRPARPRGRARAPAAARPRAAPQRAGTAPVRVSLRVSAERAHSRRACTIGCPPRRSDAEPPTTGDGGSVGEQPEVPEARPRLEFAPLYPGLEPGVGQDAAAFTDQMLTEHVLRLQPGLDAQRASAGRRALRVLGWGPPNRPRIARTRYRTASS